MDNEEETTEVVPFGYEFPEEPEIIEGEFREIPEEGEGILKKLGRAAYEDWKRRKELEEIREEARAMRGYPKKRPSISGTAGAVRRIATLGGVPKVVHKELYVGSGVPREFYVPTGMRRLTTPFTKSPAKEALMPGRDIPAGKALTPGLERLRKAGELEAKPTELDLSQLRGGLTITNLQMDQKPRGWTEAEWLVFREIRSNHDIDTVEHVTEEVVKFGGGKAAAGTAIKNLIKRGVVFLDKSFPGEPVLRVIPRR